MKNLLIILISFTTIFFSNREALAQYAIPVYYVEIVSDPTTFEEVVAEHSQSSSTKPIFIQAPNTKERRKINVQVSTAVPNQTASATIKLYSLDGEDFLGPFYVTDEAIFEQEIDEREWGVSVLSASESCEMSVWID